VLPYGHLLQPVTSFDLSKVVAPHSLSLSFQAFRSSFLTGFILRLYSSFTQYHQVQARITLGSPTPIAKHCTTVTPFDVPLHYPVSKAPPVVCVNIQRIAFTRLLSFDVLLNSQNGELFTNSV